MNQQLIRSAFILKFRFWYFKIFTGKAGEQYFKTMRKILLPTDFSENALNAISHAVQLFRQDECVFYLLNCYTPDFYNSDFRLYKPTSTLSMADVNKKHSRKELEKVRDIIKINFPNQLHSFKLISSTRSLKEEIQRQILKQKIELIVMGTQGATSAAKIIFGTNTVQAIQNTLCPLLAIPSGHSFQTPQKICFPTDLEINYSKNHLSLLKDLAEKHVSTIDIVHVSFGYPLATEQEEAKKILAEYFDGISHNFHHILRKTVTEGIYDFQEEQETDLLAMISNKHSFFDNLLFRPVINEIGFSIKTPFLVIPSGKFNT